MKSRPLVLLATMCLFAVHPVQAETAGQIIAKARAYLGSESALNSVRTIHFTGVIEIDATNKFPAEITFQKDARQKIMVTQPKVIETTALDGYDAWQKNTNPQNPSQWQVTLLPAAQVKRLRANTWENLHFFAGIEKVGGIVQIGPDVVVDGVPCVVLSFIHSEKIVFKRYFDRATGRLVKTETEDGGEIREEGEIMVNGIRFPQKVINKAANGKATTISFDKVVLNEAIPASEFAVPTLQPN